METVVLELPMLYGDHHVLEVRRLLTVVPGVADVYASSAFHLVEVSYDPAATHPETIKATLAGAGYLSDLPVPEEVGAIAAKVNGQRPYFRHTAAFEPVRQVVSFAQEVPEAAGRPLWPCPGMGVITVMSDE
ncbi:MAG: heavy-metal-associated domain-containing protein [Chloroflexota bacterium]